MMQLLLRICVMTTAIMAIIRTTLATSLRGFCSVSWESLFRRRSEHRIKNIPTLFDNEMMPGFRLVCFAYTTPRKIPNSIISLNPKSMFPNLRLLRMMTAVVVLSLITLFSFGQATVVSDQPDYAPRATAIFTGSGFTPNEDVVLKVKNLSRSCNTIAPDSSYLAWTITADSNGNFVTSWIVCDCPGDSLRLKAAGLSSEFIAYAYFTDSPNDPYYSASIGTLPATVNIGTSTNYTLTINNLVANPPSANQNGNISSFTIAIPAGITTPFPVTSAVSQIIAMDPGSVDRSAQWIVDPSSTSTLLKFKNNASGDAATFDIDPGGSIVVNFIFTANSLTPNLKEWTTSVSRQSNYNNNGTFFSGSQPTVTYYPANQGPASVGDIYNITEDNVLTVAAGGVLTNDTDPDGNSLTAILVSGPAAADGTLALNSDGSFTFTPAANFNGPTSFTYKSNDGSLDGNTVTVTINVAAVNDQPTLEAISNPAAIDEDATEQTVGLSGIGTGAANEVQTLSVTATSSNTLLIADPVIEYTSANSTGSLKYTPVANANGTAIITVTVDDGGSPNNTIVKTFTVTVNAVNDKPTLDAISNPAAIDEDATEQTVGLSGIGTGAANETQALLVTATSNNTSLIANPVIEYISANATGSLKYTPVANANGTAIITVTVDDGGSPNNTIVQTFTVTVNAVNDQPRLDAINNPVAIDEDAAEQTVGLSGIGTGAANEAQTLSVMATSSNTLLIPNPVVVYTSANSTGSLKYTPIANANGTVIITVTVNDGGSENNTIIQTFTVTVNAVNDQPTLDAISDPAAIDEDAAEQTVGLSGIGTGAANEAQTLSVTATSSNTLLIPDPVVVYTSANSIGSLKYTPVANAYGTAIITVTVDDGSLANNTIVQTFTVTVNAVNDQPTLSAISDPAAIDEDAAEQTVGLSGIGTGAANEIQALVVTATSNNTSLIPNPLVVYTSANPTGSLKYTPVANANGTAIITVTVNDGGSANSTIVRTFTVTVNAVNDQPTLDAINSPAAIDEDATEQTVGLSGIGTGAANENDALVITATSSNTALIPNPVVVYTSANPTGSLKYTPVANAFGTATITVTVDDLGSGNNTIVRSFTVTVNAVNDQPTLDAISDPGAIDEDAAEQTIGLSGIGTGAANETQALLVTATSNNTSLIANPVIEYISANATGSLKYTPVANANGTAIITVTVDDGGSPNNTIVKTFTVTVNAVNDQPTLNAISNPAAIDEDATEQTVGLSGIGTGAANEIQVLVVTATSNNTSLIPNPIVVYTSANPTGSLKYTPVANANGTAIITVTVNDGGSLNNTVVRTFTVTVNPVNDAPVVKITGTPQTVDYSDPIVSIGICATDIDNTCGSLNIITSYQVGSSNVNGLPTGLALTQTSCSGSIKTWTITGKALVAPGTYMITVKVSDNAIPDGTNTSTGTIQLIVEREDADVTYTSPEYFTLPSASATSFKVLLSATVKDITAVPPSTDSHAGRITYACVEFHKDTEDGIVLAKANVALVDPADTTIGVASAWSDCPISNTDLANGGKILNVVPVVIGYYTAIGEVQQVTIAVPGSEFVTGGGYVVNKSTRGTFAARTAAKTNFGFTMKYAKNGSNLKGQANIIVRSNNIIYQIKSNAINTLSVGSKTAAGTPAYFVTKANYTYTDITNPLAPVTYTGSGNLDLTVKMNDFSNGGQGDEVSILLMDGSKMLFSSNWDGTQPALQALGGGNVSVRNSSTTVTPLTTIAITGRDERESLVEAGSFFNLSAYPNPTASQFTVKIETSNTRNKISLRVMDMHGRMIEAFNNVSPNSTMKLGASYGTGIYFVEMIQGDSRKLLKVMKR
jgi:Cadherin-like domain/Secretion system C-terminal sorting domain